MAFEVLSLIKLRITCKNCHFKFEMDIQKNVEEGAFKKPTMYAYFDASKACRNNTGGGVSN